MSTAHFYQSHGKSSPWMNLQFNKMHTRHSIPQPVTSFLECIYTGPPQPRNKNHYVPSPQTDAIAREEQRIAEQEVKQKLTKLFVKDKKKYHQTCDQFMYGLQLDEHCNSIKLIEKFIMDSWDSTQATLPAQSSQRLSLTSPQQQTTTTTRLFSFSTRISFLSSIFSRDKISVLIQLHGVNQKILNFLNFLYISLQSFAFTNQKEWILMKDQIQRYLAKYEQNVGKLLEIDDDEEENQEERGNCNEVQKKRSQKRKKQKKSNKSALNLNLYKKQTKKIRRKLAEQQLCMSSALRNSFLAWYEKYEVILDQLNDEFKFICGLILKAEKFKKSCEKESILQFLIQTRKKAIESMIFMQQVYKHILCQLQLTRRKMHQLLEDSVIKGSQLDDEMLQLSRRRKQQKATENVDVLFGKFQSMLCVHQPAENNVMESSIVRVDPCEGAIESVQMMEAEEVSSQEKPLIGKEGMMSEDKADDIHSDNQKQASNQEEIQQDQASQDQQKSATNKQQKTTRIRKPYKKRNKNIIIRLPSIQEQNLMNSNSNQHENQKEKCEQQKQKQCISQSEQLDHETSSLMFLQPEHITKQQQNKRKLQAMNVKMKKQEVTIRNGFDEIQSLSLSIPMVFCLQDQFVDEDVDISSEFDECSNEEKPYKVEEKNDVKQNE